MDDITNFVIFVQTNYYCMYNSDLKENLQRLLKHKKSKEYYAKQLNVTLDIIEKLLSEIRNTKVSTCTEETTKKYNYDKDTFEISTYYQEEPTPEQIIRDHKINTSEYKLSGFWSKAKEKGWHVSANFTKLKGEEYSQEAFISALNNYKSTYVPRFIKNKSNDVDTHCALISLPDAHIDKLAKDGKSVEEKCDMYFTVLAKLTQKAMVSHNVEEIVFVIGNDFFHTDSIHNTTTNGTNLFVNTEWNNAYEMGFDLMVKSIDYLRSFCPKVHVVLVQGNHPRTKEFYLAHALASYFKPDVNITFDRTTKNLKVYPYGETLLCFNHGNNVNDKLPLAFATSFHQEWGMCKYKEILLGDKHHNSEKLIKSQGEAFGVRMRILPSLSGTDQWHDDNLFINSIQAGIAIIYHKTKGRVTEMEERI